MTNLNLNVNFDLNSTEDTDNQIENLQYLLEKLKNLGIDVSASKPIYNKKSSFVGPLEQEYLQKSGKSWMRCETNANREMVAMERLQNLHLTEDSVETDESEHSESENDII